MDLNTKEYKDFEVIFSKDIADCSSRAFYLKHKKTGLEVFHLYNEDKENLCSFSFRTPPENSNGIAHILEHSVLCGSEKYPLKDPFIHLENQSLKTFLNAMTASDRTMYPVSSVVEEDYFNLASVYADSVFFPKLNKEVFLQEAHRLEKDEDGNYSIQGVVYNEMKGCYSSFMQVCDEIIDSSILPGTIYEHDSGGDPLEIPDLTYEKYLETHKRFYRPDNCLVFFYGNISTEKQLDFLQNSLLNRIEERMDLYPQQEQSPLDVIKKTEPQVFESVNRVEAFGPNVKEKDKDEDPSVYVTWRLFENTSLEQSIEARLLSEILVGNDSSPLVKALIDSGLVTEMSSYTGIASPVKYICMTVGVDGVKHKNIDKIIPIIDKTVKTLIKKGIPQDDIDCALMGIEIENKEVRRSSGPFSLVLMNRVLRGWTYGYSPDTYLYIREALNTVKEKIKNDKTYLTQLLKNWFLDNSQRSLCVVTPSPKYAEERRRLENEQIDRLKSLMSDSDLEEQTKGLREFQQKDETEVLKCLPHINARNIQYEIPQVKSEVQLLEYAENKNVPFVYNVENTNGMSYFTCGFPVDVLDPEDYNYVSLFYYMVTELGWNGKSWDKCAKIVNKYSGSFSCVSYTSTCSETELGKDILARYGNLGIIGRDMVFVRVRMLSENTKQCLDFFADCIKGHNFNDVKRVKLLFDEFVSDFENYIAYSGNSFMSSRAAASFNKSKAADELFNGITNLYFIRELKEKLKGNIKPLCRKLSSIAQKVFSSGAVVDLICDSDFIDSSIEEIKVFAKKLSLKQPDKPNPLVTLDSLKEQLKIEGRELSCEEYFEKDIQVGFGCCVFPCSRYATPQASAEAVYAHWLSNTLLWERIRTICGAYGAYANNDSVEKQFIILTYRDPNPYKSLAEIAECLKLGAEKVFTEAEVEKAVTGRFSSELRPRTPRENGFIGFERIISCIHQDDVNRRISLTLQVTPEDMHEAAVRLYDNFKANCRNAVLCPKTNIVTSNIEKIEL